MTGQTRKHSFLESMTNVAVGYGVAVAGQLMVFPHFGINVPLQSNMAIAGVFTVISLVRSYCLRRVFNAVTMRQSGVNLPNSMNYDTMDSKLREHTHG